MNTIFARTNQFFSRGAALLPAITLLLGCSIHKNAPNLQSSVMNRNKYSSVISADASLYSSDEYYNIRDMAILYHSNGEDVYETGCLQTIHKVLVFNHNSRNQKLWSIPVDSDDRVESFIGYAQLDGEKEQMTLGKIPLLMKKYVITDATANGGVNVYFDYKTKNETHAQWRAEFTVTIRHRNFERCSFISIDSVSMNTQRLRIRIYNRTPVYSQGGSVPIVKDIYFDIALLLLGKWADHKPVKYLSANSSLEDNRKYINISNGCRASKVLNEIYETDYYEQEIVFISNGENSWTAQYNPHTDQPVCTVSIGELKNQQ